MRAPAALVALSVTAVVLLTSCEAAEDAARDAASDAACGVAQQAVDGAVAQVRQAVPDIQADPQAAERELRAVRDTLAAAEQGVDGELAGDVTRAREAVDALLTEAESAAAGEAPDNQAVADAQADLDAAVADVKGVC